VRRSIVVVSLLSLALAGCGGGAMHAAVPRDPSAVSNGSHLAHPDASNATATAATIWYALGGSPQAIAFLAYGEYGGVTLPSSASQGTTRALTVGSDGSVYVLAGFNEQTTTPAWTLFVYAPGATSASAPERVISGSGHPQEVVLVADGIDVLASAATKQPAVFGAATLSTYAYAGGGSPIRTLALGYNVSDVAADRQSRLYVAHTDQTGVRVLTAGATSYNSAIREIKTSDLDEVAVAVAPDGTVYVLTSPSPGNATLNAFVNGSNGPTPARAITGLLWSNSALSVDANGQVYVASVTGNPMGGMAFVNVYADFAAGSKLIGKELADVTLPAPFNPASTTVPKFVVAPGPGIAVPTSRPVSTFYVAYPNRVEAFPAGANGNTNPARIVSVTGTARGVAADGTTGALEVVAQGTPPPNDQRNVANVYSYSTAANGATTYLGATSGGTISAVAFNSWCNSVDMLDSGYFDQGAIERIGVGGSTPCTQEVTASGTGLGVDAIGDRYVASPWSGAVSVYDREAGDFGDPQETYYMRAPVSRWFGSTASSGPFEEGLAVTPEGIVYVGLSATGAQTPSPGAPMKIEAFLSTAQPGTAPSRVITGSFTYPMSLAIGPGSSLVVLHDDRVDTFGAEANGAATPVRSFPVPPGSIAGPSALAAGP